MTYEAVRARIERRCFTELDLNVFDAMLLEADALIRIGVEEFTLENAAP
jgi:hypothetical protein